MGENQIFPKLFLGQFELECAIEFSSQEKNNDSFGILNEFIKDYHRPFSQFLFRFLIFTTAIRLLPQQAAKWWPCGLPIILFFYRAFEHSHDHCGQFRDRQLRLMEGKTNRSRQFYRWFLLVGLLLQLTHIRTSENRRNRQVRLPYLGQRNKYQEITRREKLFESRFRDRP